MSSTRLLLLIHDHVSFTINQIFDSKTENVFMDALFLRFGVHLNTKMTFQPGKEFVHAVLVLGTSCGSQQLSPHPIIYMYFLQCFCQ